MDYQDIIVSCKSCEIKTPMSKTKFDRSGHNLVCLKCYKDLYGEKGERILQTVDPSRTNFSCSYCGYKFSRTKGFNLNGICPYCSKPAIQADGQKASEMISKSSPEKRFSNY